MKTPIQRLRRDVWDTMSLAERAVRKAERRVDELIENDKERHGGVLRLREALTLLHKARMLIGDHEDALS